MRPSGAPSASATRWTSAGGNGSCTVSKCDLAITASRSGLGIPLRFVLPSAASVNIVSNQRLKPQRRAHLQQKARVGLAGVPEAMRRARLNGCDLAWARRELAIADAK